MLCTLWIILLLITHGSMVLSDEEMDKTDLLTYGLEDWMEEEGSGFLDDEKFLTGKVVDHRNNMCANSFLKSKDRNFILYTHNRLRSKLAHGLQPNKEGMMSSGKNIYLLKWDCDLEQMARLWAGACPTHPMAHAKIPSGSQLAKQFDMTFHGSNASEHIEEAMRSWWLEYKTHGNNDFKNRYSHRQNYYGWANMAKGKTTRIGCSYSICERYRAIFTCVYNSKAHCEKRTIYEPGEPCGCDDDCSTYPNSKCIAKLGLCQAPDIQGDRTLNQMCGPAVNNSRMTDYSRKMVLDLHNFYRSRLARGLEFNGETNTTQPSARNMMKLEYDCYLEKYAQAWADGCKFEHSNNWERPNQGQNLYMTTIKNWETTSLLHTALEIWWKELEEFGMPSNAVLTEDVWTQKGSLIGHFTQMACGKSQRLGCAVSKCPDMEYVVCHYSPSGNRKRHAVYELGPSCTKNTDCPLDTSCITREGLCAVRETSEIDFL